MMETLPVHIVVLLHGLLSRVERAPRPPCSSRNTSTRTVLIPMHILMTMQMVCTRVLQVPTTPGPFSALLAVHRCRQHQCRQHQYRQHQRQCRLLEAGNHVLVGCVVIQTHQSHNIVLMVNDAKHAAQLRVSAQVAVVVAGNRAVVVFVAIHMQQSHSIVQMESSVKSVEVMPASVLVE